MPLVSVHIVTYNSISVIGPCLDALRAQRMTDFGIRIIDNASTDDSVALIEALGYPVTVNSRNVGYAMAHNQAIDSTDSAYVLTLNPDAQLAPDFLEAMVTTLDQNERVGSAAGRLLRVESLADAPPPKTMDGAGLYMRRNRRQGLRCEGAQPDDCDEPVAIFGPDGAAAFYRRAMLDDVRVMGEVFDTDFFMHKEDIDLCWRAQLRGWSSLYVPEARALHVRGFRPGLRANVSADVRRYAVRNRYLLLIKNELPTLFWRDLWAIALYELSIAAYMLLRERESLRTYADVWRLRRRMIEKRQIIQARRRVTWREMRQWFR